MSYLEVEGLSKSELKNRLTQMGMSLDKLDHPKDFYMQLYLDKYNAKNKVTRDNTPFYKEQVLRGKREREKSYDGQNYDEVDYAEEDDANNYGDDDDEDYVYEESEESNENKIRRRKRKAKTIKFDEKNLDYRESGIKNIRLIRSKKKRILKNKARDGHEQINVKRNIFVVSVPDQKAGQNNEYYTNNNNNNYINENTKRLNENNGQQYLIKNNEYNVYSTNVMPDDTRKMIKLKVEKLYCDGDDYIKRNQYQNEADLSPNNYNRIENQYYGVESRENYNQNLRSSNKNSANSKNNSGNYLSTQYRNSNGNSSQKYNFFIRNITQTVKDDLKKNQMSSKSKNVLVNSDSMNQIEGNNEFNYNNSNNNLRSSPYQDDMEMNNQEEVVVFPRILKGRNKEIQDQQLSSNLPKDQIVSDSINKTTIMEQYNNSQTGNSGRRGKDDNNFNYESINEYKKKLRSYSKNKGNNSPEEDIDDNNNYNQNNNINYINDKINSSNQNYNTAIDNDNNYEVNNNNSNINTDFNDKFNNNDNREQYMNSNENMGNLRSSNNFNNKSNDRNNLNQFSSKNYNNQSNMIDTNGVYESNPNNNNYSGYNNQNNLNEEDRMNYSNNYNNQNDINNRSNLKEFNSGNYNNQTNINDNNGIYESNQNYDNNYNYSNQNNLNDDHRMDFSNNYNNNQNDLNQYGANLDQRIKYNNGGNNSILNSNIIFDENDMNNYNNNNQFSGVVNPNNMSNNYENGDYELAGRNSKNNIMDKFKKYIYLFPLILLIVFGIAYFFIDDENYRTNIIYVFSILMGLLVLYLLFMYIKDKKRYKKMAREDREELLNELQRRNIRIENLIDNIALLNNFIERRIQHHKVNQEEYINYVFPYLQKFLKKDGLELSKEKEENPINYWIEI